MYVKLFARITESSLVEEPVVTRWVFVALLAIADPRGYVIGTDVALARRLNVSEEEFADAMTRLMSPDPSSNSLEQDGRRVVRSDGERGYFIVNYLRYSKIRDEDHRREYMRDYMRDYMREKRGQEPVKHVKLVKQSLAKAEEDEEEEDTQVGLSAEPTPEDLPLEAQLWNAEDNLPKVRKVSTSRLRVLRARRKDPFFCENIGAAIKRIAATPFCLGAGSRGWKASFDWLLQPDTVLKVMEGKYDSNGAETFTPGQLRSLNEAIAETRGKIEELREHLRLTVIQDREKKRTDLKAARAKLSELQARRDALLLEAPQPTANGKAV